MLLPRTELSPVFEEESDHGGQGNSEDDTENWMYDSGEADAKEHCKDDGNGRQTYCPFHNERDEEVILAPLDDVVDRDNDCCP